MVYNEWPVYLEDLASAIAVLLLVYQHLALHHLATFWKALEQDAFATASEISKYLNAASSCPMQICVQSVCFNELSLPH